MVKCFPAPAAASAVRILRFCHIAAVPGVGDVAARSVRQYLHQVAQTAAPGAERITPCAGLLESASHLTVHRTAFLTLALYLCDTSAKGRIGAGIALHGVSLPAFQTELFAGVSFAVTADTDSRDTMPGNCRA